MIGLCSATAPCSQNRRVSVSRGLARPSPGAALKGECSPMVTADRPTLSALEPFVNTPLLDFDKPENARAQEEALRQVESEFGLTYPLIIGGQRRQTAETFASINPAHPDQVV